MKYDILFIILRYAGHPCFVLKIEGYCIFSNHVALILNVAFAPFILANQRRDTAPLNRIHDSVGKALAIQITKVAANSRALLSSFDPGLRH